MTTSTPMTTPTAPVAPTTPRWCNDPAGRHQMRWWDGTRWTDHVADDQMQSVDAIATEAPPIPPPPPAAAAPAAPVPTDWRERPEGLGTFVFNVVLCLLFPIVTLWYVPKYLMRREYWKAVICFAVPVIALMLLAALMAG